MSIEKIKIVIKTAIPGKEAFDLKRDVLYIPDSQDKAVPSSEYPFITSTRLFNKSELQNYAYTYGYSKVVFYFFDKIMFERLFTQFTFADNVEPMSNNNDDDKKKRKQKIKENLIANTKTMLELLFPMTYPATLNISDSYTLYIRQNIDFDLNTAFSNITKTFFKKIIAVTQSVQTKNFSYIKVDGTTYTVTKVLWLNDLLNHPVYRDFINEFIGFKQLASKERESLEGIITNKKNILFERLQNLDESSSSLNIYTKFVGVFVKNFNENIKSLRTRGIYETSSLQQFINDLKNLILLLLNVFSLHYKYDSNNISEIQKRMETNINIASSEQKTPIDDIVFDMNNISIQSRIIEQDDYLPSLSILINDINELYKKIKENNTGSLTGISGAFTSRLNKISEEIKSINVNITIKEKYLSDKTTINLTGEDQEVVDTLVKKFPSYISFADKIKALIYTTRTTTNIELQERIDNYSNGKNINTPSFDDIMEAIKDQYILMTTVKPTRQTKVNLLSNPKHQNLIQTEISVLSDSNPDVPHYEIYIALNLIEGELKSDNINDVKCVYRSMFLGKELQNYFTRYNKYDVNQHLFLLSQKDIDEEKITNKTTVTVIPDKNNVSNTTTSYSNTPETRPPEKVQGGTRKKIRTRKLKSRRNKPYKFYYSA